MSDFIKHKRDNVRFQQKDGTGAIFVNDRKEQDNHPDRTGTAMVSGRAYYINGWLKKTKAGKPYMSVSFKPKHRAAVERDDEVAF
jgi:hypothetical protein